MRFYISITFFFEFWIKLAASEETFLIWKEAEIYWLNMVRLIHVRQVAKGRKCTKCGISRIFGGRFFPKARRTYIRNDTSSNWSLKITSILQRSFLHSTSNEKWFNYESKKINHWNHEYSQNWIIQKIYKIVFCME